MTVMVLTLISVFSVFVILCLSELLWRAGILRGEYGRKFIHIIVGTFVAFWPFMMSFAAIRLVSLAFLAVILFTRRVRLFHAIYSIKRRTWGEISFAVSIGLLALLPISKWIFTAAVLHMSLADGLAALVGTRYGHKSYYLFGQRKTLVGSLTFGLVSALILSWLLLVAPAGFSRSAWPLVVTLPVAASALENMAVVGLDNVLVPLLITFALKLLPSG